MFDGIAPLGYSGGRVYVEGDEEVGDSQVIALAWMPANWDFAQHKGGVRRTEVAGQGSLVGGTAEIDGVLHIVPGWTVWEPASRLVAGVCGTSLLVITGLVLISISRGDALPSYSIVADRVGNGTYNPRQPPGPSVFLRRERAAGQRSITLTVRSSGLYW